MPHTPPRFLYVGNHAGHFLTHRLPVMQAIRDAGYEVHVAASADADKLENLMVPDAINKIRSMGFIYHPIPIKRSNLGLSGEIRLMFHIYQLFTTLKPDLVYLATIKPVLYGGILARLTQIPAVISMVTGLGYVFLATGLKATLLRAGVKTAYRLALGHTNMRVILQNPDDQAAFIQQKLTSAEKTVVIRGAGADIQHFTPASPPSGIPLVILPSRMLWDKGVSEFVNAATQLRQDGVQARFALVGDTDPSNLSAISRDQLQCWHDSGIVEWWGWRDDMLEIFRQAHIICLPSYREGMPKALIEAAACGKPIITTDVPGCREIVRDNFNGLLVPARNIDKLTEALKRLIENHDLRTQMGIRSREIVEKEFSTQMIIMQTLALCEQLSPFPA